MVISLGYIVIYCTTIYTNVYITDDTLQLHGDQLLQLVSCNMYM